MGFDGLITLLLQSSYTKALSLVYLWTLWNCPEIKTANRFDPSYSICELMDYDLEMKGNRIDSQGSEVEQMD